MRIAIMGAGSLGTVIGALVSQKYTDTILIDVYQEHVDALNQNGATGVGLYEFNLPVKACTPDQMEGKFDYVFYLAKATANDIALNQLLPHLHEKSVVCTLQNGLPEDDVAEYVGKERTVGGTVGWGATFQSPGVTKVTTLKEKIEKAAFEVGEIDGKVTDRIKQVKEILDCVGHTTIETNLIGARWTKLFVNSTFSGMSAALGCTYGDVLDNPKALDCAAYTANEVMKTAKILGIKMEPWQGIDVTKVMFDKKEEIPDRYPIIFDIFSPHRQVQASMLNDMQRGNFSTEIDSINGKVVLYGKKAGVETPFNSKIVEIVKKHQTLKELPTMENLNLFVLP